MDSALMDYLPPPVLVALNDYVLRDGAPVQTAAHMLAAHAQDAIARAASLAAPAVSAVAGPALDRVARAAINAPDTVVLLCVVLLVVLALQVLSLVRRLLAWWTRLLFRLVFWSAAALVLAAVWQRGLAQSTQDAAALAGRLAGYAAFVGDIWTAEYNKYQQQQVQAQAATHSTRG